MKHGKDSRTRVVPSLFDLDETVEIVLPDEEYRSYQDSNPTDFTWLTSKGYSYSIKQMSTGHLCNTIRMLWNHAVPEPLRIKPYIKHTLGKVYTEAFLNEAICAMKDELQNREDLDPSFKSDLMHMVLMQGALK